MKDATSLPCVLADFSFAFQDEAGGLTPACGACGRTGESEGGRTGRGLLRDETPPHQGPGTISAPPYGRVLAHWAERTRAIMSSSNTRLAWDNVWPYPYVARFVGPLPPTPLRPFSASPSHPRCFCRFCPAECRHGGVTSFSTHGSHSYAKPSDCSSNSPACLLGSLHVYTATGACGRA